MSLVMAKGISLNLNYFRSKTPNIFISRYTECWFQSKLLCRLILTTPCNEDPGDLHSFTEKMGLLGVNIFSPNFCSNHKL